MTAKVPPSEETIIIGQFGAPHGVKGGIRVNSFTEKKEDIFRYQPWLVSSCQKTWQEVDYTVVNDTNKLIVTIQGENDRDAVKQYTNQYIAVKRDQLPNLEDGQFYWHELVGLDVVNRDEKNLGTVVELMATGANDVLVVEGNDKTQQLIPYIKGDYILNIDTKQKRILVDWDDDYQ